MSDYNFLIESRLSPEQLQVLTQVSRISADQRLNLYLVGGAVRDLTYGQQIVGDLDFAVEGNPERILRRLRSDRASTPKPAGLAGSGGGPSFVRVEHAQFDRRVNSADLNFSNGVRAEIAMTRNEVYSKPGRRPEILPGTTFEDLKRRDFSVNAMAVSLHPNSRGLLLDPANGVADIDKRELRVLHSRSFLEDPSRIYRLIRLGLRLNFKPEERTKNLLESALENRLWLRLNPEQQGRELRAVLQEENPQRVLKSFTERGLLAGLDRKLSSARIFYERFGKIRAVVRAAPGPSGFLLNFHCLVEKFSGAQKIRLAKKIIANRKDMKLALSLDRSARKMAHALAGRKAALPSHLYMLLNGQPQALLLFLLVHYPKPKIRNRVKSFLFKYPLVRARLPRAELQAMGLRPGRKFEKILDRVFFDQLDGKIKTHPQLIKALRALSGIPEPAKPAPPPKKRLKKKR